jgi:hypothetical protein
MRFNCCRENGIFSLLQCPDKIWGPFPSNPMGNRALPLGVKLPGHEPKHSPPFSARSMNVSSYTFTPPCTHAMVLNYAHGKLYFYLTFLFNPRFLKLSLPLIFKKLRGLSPQANYYFPTKIHYVYFNSCMVHAHLIISLKHY